MQNQLQARTQLFRRGCTLSLSGPNVSSPWNTYLCIIRKVHAFLLRKEISFCVRKIRNIILSITHWKYQARWKQLRISPAKIVSSAEGASTLEGSRGMLPREILKFSFSKMHTENEPKGSVKISCIWQQIDIYSRNFSTVMNISK